MSHSKKALVTGSTGFLGSHLLYFLLEHGYQVTALYRNRENINNTKKIFNDYNTSLSSVNIEWKELMVEDFSALCEEVRKCDTVFHCAAAVDFSGRNKKKVLENNRNITGNITDACLEHDKLLIHVSSVAGLGTSKESTIDENACWNSSRGRNGYAISKYYSEQEVWRGITSGLRAVIVNPSIIIGENGNWKHGSSQFFSYFSIKRLFYIDGIKGFVDVQDVVNMMIRLSENPSSYGQRFILNSENISFQEFFSNIAHFFGIRPPLWSLPLPLLYALGLLYSLLEKIGVKSSLSLSSIQSAIGKNSYDGSKVLEYVNYNYHSVYSSIGRIVRNYNKTERIKS